MVEEKCNKVADCLVPKCTGEEELFRTEDENEDAFGTYDYYGGDAYEDVLSLGVDDDEFNIPVYVCNSEPQETVAECLSGLGIST